MLRFSQWGRWLAGMLGVLLVVGSAGARPPEVSPEARDELYRRLKVLAEALDIVQKYYVEEVPSEKLIYGAVRGIVEQLDPHSSFLTPDMFHQMQVETEGTFGGLGIEVTLRDGRLVVVSPIEGTPAAAAGIQAGDIIVMIEGDPVQEMDLSESVKRMRGPRGTQITIHISRQGWDKPKPFTLTRDIIRIRSVRSHRVDDIGVIRIAQFQKETHAEVRAALDTLSNDGPLQGIVLDLRNNPGGLLDQAVKVSDIFLREGTVVSTRGRDEEQEVVFTARDDGDEPLVPMVVLVNEGTASASEIVAGALQDHGLALVLGQRSFGKGSVQTIMPLSDNSGVRVTTALYYTPSGRSIQAKGIVPDIEVAAEAAPPQGRMPPHGSMREEDLKGHFETGSEEDVAQEDGSTDNGEADPQLERAVQMLKSYRILSRTGAAAPPPVRRDEEFRLEP